jgi:hypothetical protein
VYLHVASFNQAALSFYRRAGFKECAVLPDFYTIRQVQQSCPVRCLPACLPAFSPASTPGDAGLEPHAHIQTFSFVNHAVYSA